MPFYYLKRVVLMGTLSLFLFWGVVPAQAIPIEVNFTAAGFSFDSPTLPPTPPPPPTDPVTGTITYEADSVTADIISLTSIDLSIDGHTYSISEIGFMSPFSSNPIRQKIGGLLNNVDQIAYFTDDFYLDWRKVELTPFFFFYTSSLHEGRWKSTTFTSFSVAEANPVPEPATMLLLGSGLIGLVGLRRKKFFKK